MSLTLRDCLKLPAFSHAEIVAGGDNLDQIVNSITVLEYAADPSVISADLFINHEICITAFSSIKNDVEKQCTALRRLRDVGIVALVLYYVGIFVPLLDEKLLATADELHLPLFCMPHNRFDIRYSEMINDVTQAIYRSQTQETSFVPEMMQIISQLQEPRRTIGNLLRMISDRLRCSLLLTDIDFRVKGEALWPMATSPGYRALLEELRQDPALLESPSSHRAVMNQQVVYVSHAPVTPNQISPLNLFAVDSTNTLTRFRLGQAAELVELSLNMWDYTFEKTSPDMIVKAILNNEPIRVNEIAGHHRIDPAQLQTMWILRENANGKVAKQNAAKHAAVAKKFMQQHQRWVVMDTYQDTVVMMFNATTYQEFDIGLPEAFLRELDESGESAGMAVFTGLLNSKDTRDAYGLYEKCHAVAQRVYPHKRILDIHNLRFVEGCVQILELGEPTLTQQLYPLKNLRNMKSFDELLTTLTVYLLDADSNMDATSRLLFVHKSTIKYRIRNIRECFGADKLTMPAVSALYQAVALLRLMEG